MITERLRKGLKRLLGVQTAEFAMTPYELAVEALLSASDELKVVIIGANDGRINDPIYNCLRRHVGRTSVLAIEPQAELIPHLASNYQWHTDFVAVDCAIGRSGDLKLYYVKESARGALTVPYAKGWPSYRAATGVTSSDRGHVLRWLRKFAPANFDLDGAIGELDVECVPLKHVLDRTSWARSFDVLQVDAEGADDQVLYACDLEETKPKLIYFEARNLPAERARLLTEHLEKLGYVLFSYRNDTLAIRSRYQKCSAG